MTSPSGLFFTYLLGAIFTVGGVVFLLFLDDNRLLFGLPYLAIGLALILGVWSAQRRKRRHDTRLAAEDDGPDQAPGAPSAG